MFPRASSRELSLLHELVVSDVRVVWYAAKQSFGDIPSQAEHETEDKAIQPGRDNETKSDDLIQTCWQQDHQRDSLTELEVPVAKAVQPNVNEEFWCSNHQTSLRRLRIFSSETTLFEVASCLVTMERSLRHQASGQWKVPRQTSEVFWNAKSGRSPKRVPWE